MKPLNIRHKITGILILYFLVALIAIGSTLFVSWKLEGGAAAINDAGSERMRSYYIAFLLAQQIQKPTSKLQQTIQDEITQFEKVLADLERGDSHRPLSLPKNDEVRAQMNLLRHAWVTDLKPRTAQILNTTQLVEQELLLEEYRPIVENYVLAVNDLVLMVEDSNARATTLLRSFQIGLVSLAFIGTVLLVHLFSMMVVRPVTRLREGLQRMGKGDFDVRLPVASQDELGDLATGFNRMASDLQDIYTTLEQRVEEKTKSVEVKNKELAALDKEMAVFEERNLLAQELHDSIAQSLAFLNIQVQLLHEDLQKGNTVTALQGLEQIREGVQESYDDVRELLVHFRTRIGNADLETAMRSALDKFEGQTSIRTSFECSGTVPELSPEHVLQIMHIVHESLSNVRKHAKANQVKVNLLCNETYALSIQDNGIGFNAARDASDTHVGLHIMRERAHKIGAVLYITAAHGKGTRVCLELNTLTSNHNNTENMQ
ncbi:MAG: type IV pili methyl-accepting chemotaxis transducer N-terminal domain-containing protein [Pseudomonadota bacterium]